MDRFRSVILIGIALEWLGFEANCGGGNSIPEPVRNRFSKLVLDNTLALYLEDLWMDFFRRESFLHKLWLPLGILIFENPFLSQLRVDHRNIFSTVSIIAEYFSQFEIEYLEQWDGCQHPSVTTPSVSKLPDSGRSTKIDSLL